jgi:predicted nucleic acid-binding protein
MSRAPIESGADGVASCELARLEFASILTRKAVLDLPSTVFVRSRDALHLACAEEHGFQEVYTNDRHMLQAAKHFHVVGVNVLSESS